jgi:hypothetical protein
MIQINTAHIRIMLKSLSVHLPEAIDFKEYDLGHPSLNQLFSTKRTWLEQFLVLDYLYKLGLPQLSVNNEN